MFFHYCFTSMYIRCTVISGNSNIIHYNGLILCPFPFLPLHQNLPECNWHYFVYIITKLIVAFSSQLMSRHLLNLKRCWVKPVTHSNWLIRQIPEQLKAHLQSQMSEISWCGVTVDSQPSISHVLNLFFAPCTKLFLHR